MTGRSDVLLDIADLIERVAVADQLGPPQTAGGLLAEAVRGNPRAVRHAVQVRSLTETGPGSSLLAAGQPVVGPPQQRRLFLRDRVPVVPASTFSVPFVRELNPQSSETGASGVAEGALSVNVENAVNFQPIPVQPGMLAINLTATEQLVDDSPAFVQYVDSRLPYLARVREEVAAFSGNGEVGNAGIVGILRDPAVTAGAVADAALVSTVLSLAANVAANGAVPDSAFVNAGDWLRALRAAYSTGTAGLSIGVLDEAPFDVLPSVSIPSGTVVVGDFARGAALVERAGVTVEYFPQHADYRARNLVLIQATERVGFVITQPWAFSYATGGAF